MKASALILAGLAALSGQAHAQAYQCRVPGGALSIPAVKPDSAARAMPVNGYTLALSWSPEFCRKAMDSFQCSSRHGRFGLVVHGLWPEGRGGSWPQWCPTRSAVPEPVARQHLCMTPSPSLMARQWAKHGACMVREPEAYFKVTSILWRSLRLPDLDRLSRQNGLTASDVRKAFVMANPSLEAESIGIITSRSGWLKEIRVCYARTFRPARCDRQRLGAGGRTAIRIWRGL